MVEWTHGRMPAAVTTLREVIAHKRLRHGGDPVARAHALASLMIAAGVGVKHLQTYLGHSSITTTLDIYGHLMPGSEEEAAGLLDAYLAADRKRAEANTRAAGSELAGELSGEPLAS